MKTGIYAALASALMMTCAATAQEAPSGKSYGLTLGPTLFVLPDIQTGVVTSGPGSFSPTAGGAGFGLNIGFSAGFGIGKVGDLDAVLGISGFASIGNSNTTVVDTFSGPGVVTIGGYTTPANANIALTTNSAPGNSAAKSAIIHVNPQGGANNTTADSPINPGGAVNTSAPNFAGTGNSFALAAVATGQGAVNSSAAYGAVAATDGGVFFGAGDLTGLKVTTNVARGVVYTGSDVTVALAGLNGDVSIQGYVGPSYRYLSQSITTTTSVDIPEVLPVASPGVAFPTYKMTRGEQLTSHYVGGVLGVNLSKPISDTMTFSLGAEGGLYYTHDSLKGSESYSLGGGGPTAVALTTVNNANGIDLRDNGVAWSARVSPSVTVALAPNRQLTFGGAVDYLSRVASVSRNGAVPVASTYAGTDDGSLTYSAAANTVNQLTFAPMWSFTPTMSLTGQF